MIKNVFYLILRTLPVLKIFKLLSRVFGHVENMACLKDKVIFRICGVTTWLRILAGKSTIK